MARRIFSFADSFVIIRYHYQGMKILAPAKINLSLRVVGRRPDGFHDIETLMVGISLADELELVTTDGPGLALTCNDPGVPTDESNLVIKAAQCFFAETGLEPKARFHLIKRIPWGAGLGGGSSDAAAALRLLDQAHDTQLGVARLEELAGRIGSDVAWFVRGQPAVCRGRGELVEPLKDPLPTLRVFLLKPPFGVPTPWAYRRWSESRPPPAIPRDVDGVPLFNDLESPVFEKFILLPVLKHWLEAQPGVLAATMSGSGSTVFAVLQPEANAEALADNARSMFGPTLWTHECSTLPACALC
ncbi:MAG: 4-(cytidine 5'-diphospho)-2-C-methyl-D-erythritol kinase [Terrimicrobiaceae bacterium]